MINYLKYLLLILFSSISFATTIHVATTGSDDTGDGTEANPYATIQKGVEISNAGDTILVESGFYENNLQINKNNITIMSVNGQGNTYFSGRLDAGEINAVFDGFSISLIGDGNDNDELISNNSGTFQIKNCIVDTLINYNEAIFANSGTLLFNNFKMDNYHSPIFSWIKFVGDGENKFINSHIGHNSNSNINYWGISNELTLRNTFVSSKNAGIPLDSVLNSTVLGEFMNVRYAINSILDNQWGSYNSSAEVSYCYTNDNLEGEGNITGDPYFCDPDNLDFTLAVDSPLVGAGLNGQNIGCYPIGCGEQVFYVSNDGNNNLADGSIDNPFSTIQAAIDISKRSDTIKVFDGIYFENIMFDGKSVIGESRENTILDGSNNIGGNSHLPCVKMLSSNATFKNFSVVNCSELYNSAIFGQGVIDNVIIANNIESGNPPFYVNSGIVKFSGEIKNSTFYNNNGQISGASCNGDLLISNCIFYDNHFNDLNSDTYTISPGYGNCTTTIKNSTFFNNLNKWNLSGNINAENSIFRKNNELVEIVEGTDVSISFSNFEGGYQGEGNIDSYPLFCDEAAGDFSLASNSPCIGSGLDGSNMGALGIGCDAVSLSLTINEIMNNPSAVSDSDGEWFEVYNNGDVSHDLNGWTIKDNGSDSHVISSSLVINPGEFKVLSNNSNQSTNGGLVVDYQYDGITLANGDDELVLIDPNGTVFDSVAYDGGPEFPDLTGASMGVIDAEIDNNVGSNWQASTTAYGDGDLGTPGLPNFSSDIDVALTTIDFDTVLVGESLDKVLTISNTGNTTLVIDSIYTSSGLFTLPFTETSIETSLELIITFTPSEYGVVEDTLVIKTNDPDEGHLEISLVAFGYVPSPNIVLESTSIDFGTVMDGLTETFNLKVRNTGDVELEIDTIYISGHDAYALGDYSNNIVAGDSSNISIIFSPDDEDSFEATLNIIVLNDPDVDSLGIPLNGVGGEPAPVLVLSKDQIDFGEDLSIEETFSKQIKIYNQGLLPLEIEEILFDTNLVWSDFSDASVQPLDSITFSINFHSEVGMNYLDAKMEIILIDSAITIPIIGGYIAKIEETICKIGDDFEFNILFQNDFTMGVINLSIVDYQNLIHVNNIEPLDRFENAIIHGNSGEQADGEYYLLCYDFAGGFSTGSGPAFILTGQHSDTITQNQLVNLYFNAVEIGDESANLINVNTNLFRSGSITFYLPPTTPEGLELIFDNGVHLTWNENADANFSHFVLDKSYDSQFQTNDYTSIMVYENSYSDTSFSNGQTIYYRLSSVDSLGYVSDFTEIVSIEINLNVVDGGMIPKVYALHLNYPNPFNPTTKISYDLPEASVVSLSIYDLMGREIRTMINSEQTAGFKNIQWNATDNLGKSVPAGMYIYTIQAGEFRQTRKMVLLK